MQPSYRRLNILNYYSNVSKLLSVFKCSVTSTHEVIQFSIHAINSSPQRGSSELSIIVAAFPTAHNEPEYRKDLKLYTAITNVLNKGEYYDLL